MFDTITEPSTGESKDETSKILSNPDQLVQRFLLQTEPVFARLTGLREKVIFGVNSLGFDQTD
jgi:hypothetical protein